MDLVVRTKQPKVQQLPAVRTQADIDRFLRLVAHVDRAIKGETFYANDNYMRGVCGYTETCQEW